MGSSFAKCFRKSSIKVLYKIGKKITFKIFDFSRICSRHFRPEDFERDLRNEMLGLPLRNLLKPGSYPVKPEEIQVQPEILQQKIVKTVLLINQKDSKIILLLNSSLNIR